jgi:hypothetical protein
MQDLLKHITTMQILSGNAPFRNYLYINAFEYARGALPSLQKWVSSVTKTFTYTPPDEKPPRAEIECERGTNAGQQTKGGAPPFLTRMDAIIHYVTCTPAIKKLFAIANHDYLPYEFEPVCIDTDIYFQLKHVDVDDGTIKNIKFRIFSYEHDVRHLQKFVESCNQDYERRMQNKLGTNLYFFDQVVQKGKQRGSTQQPLPTQFLVYTKHKFVTTRTFDNVYFDQQDKVRKHTEFFLHNKRWYEKKGIPYTLGFLFHGDPGCGKTSETKAIANVAHRHIINIQLSELKTKAQLRHLFFSEEINVWNGTNLERFIIPIHERLYVIEDIDAMGDMVLRREWKKPEVKVEKSDDPFAIVDENELLKEPIDLSFLLNILDGTLESSGRMLVLTSNFPERIDRALIRPGRIDMIVKFSKCSVKVLREMVEGFYDQVAPAHRMWSDPTMEGKWTPAEVNQILFRNFDTPLEALDELETLKPADLYGFQIEGHSQTPQSEGIQLGA